MTDGKDVFDQLFKSSMKTYDIAFEKLQQVKEKITQLVVCWTIIISKTIII